jgi:type III pantothenate kinase
MAPAATAGAPIGAATMLPVKLLAADIGNTNITLGLFADAELVGSWRATSRATATADEMAALTTEMLSLDGHRLSELDAVALASVVPPLTDTFERFLRDRAGLQPTIVDAAALRDILPIEIDRPAEAGADRLCNALAAQVEFGGPAIVVDLGTSTNFDIVSAEGAYIGGAIAPGLGLSLEALVGYASKLPRIDLRRPPHAIGANTVHAMQSGTVLGYIGLVSGLLTALRSELMERSPAGSRVTVIATGGYTYEAWLREVPGIDGIEPDLTLRGIRYAWERIRGAPAPTARAAGSEAAER